MAKIISDKKKKQQAEASRRWRKNHPEKSREVVKQYRKGHLEQVQAYQKKHNSVYYEENRERLLEQKKQKYRANKEKFIDSVKRYYQSNKALVVKRIKEWRKRNPDKLIAQINKRRTKKTGAGGSYTAEEWQDLCRKHGNKCLCCGSKERLYPDHVIPVSKGGTSFISNIQPLCASCNSRKHTRATDYR